MIPKYLFHYTSLEGLKSIIKSKNIRFTRIDKLNDPYDGSIPVSNVPFKKTYFAKTTYVSCWTSQEKESISLWDLYTKMKGFRLKMKSSLFSKNMVLKESKNMIIPISNISEIDSGFNLSNQQEENVKINI